ncbi:polyprenyl diphosphate synthase [Candidatus Nardonella dryophthoridicola]|uniref:Ditrans,polycis-undecaprenyl-diphosphate synthase ((2E,6E)-farnesyl-diphosphate specific) n=1 Tax=endosymbiont of Rhynchophorus ferrugineus TaxID=1972133 RepID=A0A2Z5T3U0_9GAMM|nr:polyprenyl diphosphate synthase [Candidatus Nardonella dryophthoridicola]QTJ62817.1 di-trans,poly-cis-decaprenylcistransferase [Candidatus Nardonella dryophthoridicola]BBA85060.1 ditrans polycis-undecaprenyl-diphosphate synthase [endosymbiont of Rhynchophorus ferrugineus]
MKFNINKIPNHVAIIMDGNGRWANKKGKPRTFGHKKGTESINKIIDISIYYNLKMLTLYVMSIENINKRPKEEINYIMNIFLNKLKYEINNLNKKNIKINIIGNRKLLNKKLIFYIKETENITKNNNKLILNIAINYSGKWDLIQAFNKINYKLKTGKLKINYISESLINKYISINNKYFSNVDLLIRTGGEKRVSNFLLWNIAYSELYFTDVLWPDFGEKEFIESLISYSKRNRKFGNIK